MIKVIDEVTGTAIKIEVVGKPYQYQVRIGKVGTWTVSRGRYAGTTKTGEKWERPMYYMNLGHAIAAAVAMISENEGLPKESVVLAGAEGWKALIEQDEKLIRLVEGVHREFGHLLEKHGKDLAGLSKVMANGQVEPPEEDEDDEDDEDESDDDVDKPTDQDPLSFPKLEKRLREQGM